MRFAISILIAAGVALSAATWSIDDLLLLESASSFQLSRDGQKVLWVQSRMDKERGEPVSQIYVRYLDSGHHAQLTRGKESATSPDFSPDGQRIVFLSERPDSSSPQPDKDQKDGDKANQVWLLDLHGGEPVRLTDLEKGVKEVHWLNDDTLLLTAREDPSLYERTSKERKDTSNVVDDEPHAPPVRLFRFALKTKRTTRLTSNTDRVTHTYVSPNGRWVVTTHERSLQYEYNNRVRPATFLHDLEKQTETQLFPDGKILPRRVHFTADGAGFYFSAPYSSHPVYLSAAISLLYYYDLAAGNHTQVDLQWERALAGDFAPAPDGVLALLADGVRHRLAFYRKTGAAAWSRRWVEGQRAANIFDLALSADGKTLVYKHSTASQPEQLYSARFGGAAILDAKPVTELNTGLEGKPFAKTEVVTWKGANGDEVEGILYYPHNYEAGRRYPLVLMIHGGPNAADYDAFSDRVSYPHQLFSQRGAFILKPNYHGSSDYGLAWGESISGGKYNELEWIDCERGVDAMIERGLADPDKLGVMGWSNGSIITIEITTRTTRYKAASAGAGDVNWISDWGNCQFGHSFDDYYLGTTPLDNPQLYLDKSPLFRMDKVVTPTIIFFGTIDRQVPTEQGWQHYRALQHHGKTDTKFILFPGEAHGPKKYGHRYRKVAEELAWFDKYLFGNPAPTNESLKPSSSLAAALKLQSAGDMPETVERGGIRIGRFEVTRAQYASCKPGYTYPAGTAQYPVSGVSLRDAQAFCACLSEKAGRKFRLGTEKELEKHIKASDKENTLDAWAGYRLNADDAARLADLVKQLPTDRLIQPVGSRPGDGDDPVYDLGGNVAEWVTTEDGKGKALGGSADRPADPKASGEPSPAFIGFRVVEDL